MAEEKVFGEKERIGKLSRIREIVFGAQDGLLVPLGVVSSVAGAFSTNHIVIIAGISEALAGAFSMATGAYLSSRAEAQVHKSEIDQERNEVKEQPETEKTELKLLLAHEGIPKTEAEKLVKILFRTPRAFANTLIQKELGLEPEAPDAPLVDGIYVGLSYLVAAIIPIVPYFFGQTKIAIYYSIGLTLAALFGIGLLMAKYAKLPFLRSGLEVMTIGSFSGIGGYLLGTLLPRILGIK